MTVRVSVGSFLNKVSNLTPVGCKQPSILLFRSFKHPVNIEHSKLPPVHRTNEVTHTENNNKIPSSPFTM